MTELGNNNIYKIDCITSIAELFAIKEKYISMIKSVPDIPIFLDWDWITTWFRFYNQDRQPVLPTGAPSYKGETVEKKPFLQDPAPQFCQHT